jgi:23S rRNA (cytidine1920-2'-O)/16S rRNA (cytidine1409-2'-O)-methyltransferase
VPRSRGKAISLLEYVRRQRPDGDDPAALIGAGLVRVDGVVRTNGAFPVRPGAAVVVEPPVALRGEAKLRAALEAFRVEVAGRVALDVGAAAGGFTRVLLEAGARRVYAVDAGHGQLLGSLRLDRRVVNLEATNVGVLTREHVPEPIDVVTVDVSYLSLAGAVAQVNRVELAPGADLVGLVKPMFELRLGAPPDDQERLDRALALAISGVEAAGWRVTGSMPSPVRGARGAKELLLRAARAAPPTPATPAAPVVRAVRDGGGGSGSG